MTTTSLSTLLTPPNKPSDQYGETPRMPAYKSSATARKTNIFTGRTQNPSNTASPTPTEKKSSGMLPPKD